MGRRIFLWLLPAVAFGQERMILPHVAEGGGWQTAITLVNNSFTVKLAVEVNFHSPTGAGQTFEVAGIATSSVRRLVPPGGVAVFSTQGTGALRTGWAEILTNPSSGAPFPNVTVGSGILTAYAVYRSSGPGRPDFEAAAVPVIDQGAPLTYVYDNVSGYATSAALTNPGNGFATYRVTAREEFGVVIADEDVTLAPFSQVSFELARRFPSTAGNRGTITITPRQGRVSSLALRFHPGGDFASVPLLTLRQ